MTNKTWKVYSLLDKTGKIVYIGYTSQTLEARLNRHRTWSKEKQNLTIMLIQEFDNKGQAIAAEVLFQKQYDTVENGLNKCYGHSNHDGSRLIEAGKKPDSALHKDLKTKKNVLEILEVR